MYVTVMPKRTVKPSGNNGGSAPSYLVISNTLAWKSGPNEEVYSGAEAGLYIPIEENPSWHGKQAPVLETMESLLRQLSHGLVTKVTIEDSGTLIELSRTVITGKPSILISMSVKGPPISKEDSERLRVELVNKGKTIAQILAPGMKLRSTLDQPEQ